MKKESLITRRFKSPLWMNKALFISLFLCTKCAFTQNDAVRRNDVLDSIKGVIKTDILLNPIDYQSIKTDEDTVYKKTTFFYVDSLKIITYNYKTRTTSLQSFVISADTRRKLSNGHQINWWKNGVVKDYSRWDHGFQKGVVFGQDSSGKLVYFGEFKSNGFYFQTFHNNLKIKSEEIFDINHVLKKTVEWCENGQVIKIIEPTKKVQHLTIYHCNGKVKSKSTLVNNTYLEGEYKEWFDNGKTKEKGNYRIINDLTDSTKINAKIGKWSTYYPNGKRQTIFYYDSNGRPFKCWLYFNERGKVLKKECN